MDNRKNFTRAWRKSQVSLGFCILTVLISISATVMADGRIEINQTIVDAAGGFPYTISSPGNYVLTSDLTVPADTDGIRLGTSDVVLDLNGFAIAGSFSCFSGNCALGQGSGIVPFGSISFGRYSTVKNGAVRGFGDTCVSLSIYSRVDKLSIRSCGRWGIRISEGSIVTNNRVYQTGREGIRALASTYAQNSVGDAGLGGGAELAITGASAPGGNYCDDRSCSASGKQLFYLTKTPVNGSSAKDACDAGFHMASLWEIINPSDLQYDTARGETFSGALDSGDGPPAGYAAWIRTGFVSSESGSPGLTNCSNWSVSVENDRGSRMSFRSEWDIGGASNDISRWINTSTELCTVNQPVWCVQD